MKHEFRDEVWWDHSLLLEHFAMVLLDSADKYREHGIAEDSETIAEQMEECAWLMLSVESENGKEQETVDMFCEVIRKNLLRWWD